MSTTVGDNVPGHGTVLCPFPRSWYPPDSPCSQSDDPVTGAPQDPWVQGPGLSGVQWLFYGAVALFVLWLGVRALEAVAELKRAGVM